MKFESEIISKLPHHGQSIFSKMSALANTHQAVNLSQGFPDFSCHPDLVELVALYMRKGSNQYAPMPGVPALREAIAEKTHELYGSHYDPDSEITVTSGATLGLYAAITALVKEGDEVIVIEPAYDSYVPAITLNGGKPVFVELRAPDYRIPWNELRKLINFRTKMIIVNTPHNPSASVMNSSDVQSLKDLVRGTDLIILSDEVYEHIIFDGKPHLSMAADPELAQRSIIVSSFGKTYHTTGWKIGYLLAPSNLMEQIRRVYQFMAFSASTPVQLAFADFLKRKDLYLELPQFYQKKRDFFRNQLADSRFSLLPCYGSYFQLLQYDKISDEKDTDFAVRLTREHGIASIPVSVFYHHQLDQKVLRFCFAKGEETLEKAAEILCRL